jgi:hypothetical protein
MWGKEGGWGGQGTAAPPPPEFGIDGGPLYIRHVDNQISHTKVSTSDISEFGLSIYNERGAVLHTPMISVPKYVKEFYCPNNQLLFMT